MKLETSRDILFRAKRLDNGEWVEGYVVNYGFTGQEKWHIVASYASDLYAFEIDVKTICQYTGLTDKNGRKIWEGDVVKLTRNIGYNGVKGMLFEIYFNTYLCHFALTKSYTSYPRNGQHDYMTLSGRKAKDMEVMGNIFDNPELIGGGLNE